MNNISKNTVHCTTFWKEEDALVCPLKMYNIKGTFDIIQHLKQPSVICFTDPEEITI